MATHKLIFQPWRWRLLVVAAGVRLLLLMQATTSVASVSSASQSALLPTTQRELVGFDHLTTTLTTTTEPARARCKCHARASSKRDGQAQAPAQGQDLLPMYRDQSGEEGLQWYLHFSAYISHNQRSGAGSGLARSPPAEPGAGTPEAGVEAGIPEAGIEAGTGAAEETAGDTGQDRGSRVPGRKVTGSRPPRRHGRLDSVWDDVATDETVRGQIILEHTWSVKWGWCVSHVCDELTCRRATLSVACVGPCRWYRRHHCPKRFGGYCVTSRNYEGCHEGHDKADGGQRGKFHIINVGEDGDPFGEPARERVVEEEADGVDNNDGGGGRSTDEGSQEKDGKEEEVEEEDPVAITVAGKVGQSSEAVLLDKRKKCKESANAHDSHRQTSQVTPVLSRLGEIDFTRKSMVKQSVVLQRITPSAASYQDTAAEPPTGQALRQSDAVQSGIRYVWVVSCIVVPIMVFCIGYAISMHIRRRRFLRGSHSRPPYSSAQLPLPLPAPQSPPRSPAGDAMTDPFLAPTMTTVAPPYSIEDLIACRTGLGVSPPSYEVAMSTTEVFASADRMCAFSACSGYSGYLSEDFQLAMSCPAVLSSLMEPPPYDEADSSMVPSGGGYGRSRLPTYDSAIGMVPRTQR